MLGEWALFGFFVRSNLFWAAFIFPIIDHFPTNVKGKGVFFGTN